MKFFLKEHVYKNVMKFIFTWLIVENFSDFKWTWFYYANLYWPMALVFETKLKATCLTDEPDTLMAQQYKLGTV